MQYFDKLNFLMNITQTSNKELAAALSVDRSLISLMRSGKRGLSRKGENIKRMARFFAQRVTAQYQRHALSEMLGKTALRSPMPIEALADYLEKWLVGDPGMVGGLIDGIESIPLQVEPHQSAAPIPELDSKTAFFYGEEGRQEVMRRMMQILRKTELPSSVLVVSDDNLEWLLSNYMLTRQLQSDLLELMNKGITFHQIMPAMNFINRYTEAMQFWLPMYATGQMKVYYYPRLRDNLYRRSIVIVPGRCVRISTAIGLGSSSDITMFSTDPELVKAFTVQFQEHIALCRPALFIHRNPQESIPCFQEMFCNGGSETIQMLNSLSINTLPRELLEQCVRDADEPGWKTTYQIYLDDIPQFEERLRRGPFIDMSPLATAEEVRAGTVFVASPCEAGSGNIAYTPEMYILHLQNILRLMDQYENYHFLPYQEKKQDYNLIVSEGCMALLIHTSEPILVLDIRRPEMVLACREHLLRKAEKVEYSGIQRAKSRMELKALIRELQE